MCTIVVRIEESPVFPTYGYLVVPIPWHDFPYPLNWPFHWFIPSWLLVIFLTVMHLSALSWKLMENAPELVLSLFGSLLFKVLCPFWSLPSKPKPWWPHQHSDTFVPQFKETVGFYLSSFCLHCSPEIPKLRWKESHFNILLYYYYRYLN